MSPTILTIRGWRLFIFPNEGNEPIHIHAHKGDSDCKYWLRAKEFEIEEAYAYNITPALRREIRQIIFQHFDELVQAWKNQWKR